jgi:hypothetical protein
MTPEPSHQAAAANFRTGLSQVAAANDDNDNATRTASASDVSTLLDRWWGRLHAPFEAARVTNRQAKLSLRNAPNPIARRRLQTMLGGEKT